MKVWLIIYSFPLLLPGLKSPVKTVLICNGNTSYAYHSHHCDGHEKCRAEIEKIALKHAMILKRTPCRYCFKSKPQ